MSDDVCFLCGSAGDLLCPDCELTRSCSPAHLAKHRQANTCLPFRVKNSPGIGRYLVATRDIEPMELIIREMPCSIGPRQLVKPCCLTCLAPLQPETKPCVVCDSCNFPFCSEDCRDSDIHRLQECLVFPRFPAISDYSIEQPQYQCITPLRLLLNKVHDTQAWGQVLLHKNHTEDRWKQNPDLMQAEEKRIVGLLLDFCGLRGQGFTEDEVRMSSSLLATHSVSCGDRGRAFYPTFAFMSHSCVYNARHVISPENEISVYAQVEIKKGEEITITYTSLLTSTSEKQDKLRNLWFFNCTCKRCSDPTELGTFLNSVVCPFCPSPGTGYLCYSWEPNTWRCNTCHATVDTTMVQSLLDSTRGLMSQEPENVQKHEQFLTSTEHLLHPNNYQVIITKRYLSQLYGRKGYESERELRRKIAICNDLLAVISIIDSGFSQFRGLTEFELAMGTLQLSGYQPAGQLNQQAGSSIAEDQNKADVSFLAQQKDFQLSKEDRVKVLQLLDSCIKCLHVENISSHPGRVCKRAMKIKDDLTNIL